MNTQLFRSSYSIFVCLELKARVGGKVLDKSPQRKGTEIYLSTRPGTQRWTNLHNLSKRVMKSTVESKLNLRLHTSIDIVSVQT